MGDHPQCNGDVQRPAWQSRRDPEPLDRKRRARGEFAAGCFRSFLVHPIGCTMSLTLAPFSVFPFVLVLQSHGTLSAKQCHAEDSEDLSGDESELTLRTGAKYALSNKGLSEPGRAETFGCIESAKPN